MKYSLFGFLMMMNSVFTYPVTFGGKVYGGPRNNYPINACSEFDRLRKEFSACDGTRAATLYCQSRGYSSVQSFSLQALDKIGSSFVIGNQKIVEAGLGIDQFLIVDVTCV